MGSERPSRAVVSSAVEKSGIGVFQWEPSTSELSWDEGAAAIFGADRPGEPPFEAWLRRVHPDDRERVLATFENLDTTQTSYRLVLDDDTIRHVLARATHVVAGPDGQPTSISGVMLDVTGVQQTNARLTEVLDSASDGFLTLDRDYRYTYVNRRAELLLGMDAELLVDRVVWEAFPHAVGTEFEASYRRAMEDREPQVFEAHYPDPLDLWLEVRVQPSEEGIVVYFQDVSDRRRQQEERELLLESERQARAETDRALHAAEQVQLEMFHLATHDPLTGLANRAEFERLLTLRLEDRATSLTVLFMDLDRFKLVNDSLGHAVGDAVLVEIGIRLRSVLRVGAMAARLGGDEFVVLLEGLDSDEAQAVATRLLDEARQPVVVDSYTVATTLSIGLATAHHPATAATLLRNADVALYRAKDAGRDGFAWFDAQAHGELLDRIALEADLRVTLERGGIELHYQPMFALEDQRLVGVEALARWHHPERGPIAPPVFIPLAEDVGLISTLGAGVLRAAIEQAQHWSSLPRFTVWANVSGRELDRPGFAVRLLRDLERAGVPPDRLGIEVTESVLSHEAVAISELVELLTAGVPIAIDDFGTGYSSLARLAALPISVLKIDRSFVSDIESRNGRASIDVIIYLARVLGLRTVAEGVETPRQLELLHEAGADAAAGYLLARPAPADVLQAEPSHPING